MCVSLFIFLLLFLFYLFITPLRFVYFLPNITPDDMLYVKRWTFFVFYLYFFGKIRWKISLFRQLLIPAGCFHAKSSSVFTFHTENIYFSCHFPLPFNKFILLAQVPDVSRRSTVTITTGGKRLRISNWFLVLNIFIFLQSQSKRWNSVESGWFLPF